MCGSLGRRPAGSHPEHRRHPPRALIEQTFGSQLQQWALVNVSRGAVGGTSARCCRGRRLLSMKGNENADRGYSDLKAAIPAKYAAPSSARLLLQGVASPPSHPRLARRATSLWPQGRQAHSCNSSNSLAGPPSPRRAPKLVTRQERLGMMVCNRSPRFPRSCAPIDLTADVPAG
jgi:hypothetical protein